MTNAAASKYAREEAFLRERLAEVTERDEPGLREALEAQLKAVVEARQWAEQFKESPVTRGYNNCTRPKRAF